jgi:hypothetical protein
MTIEKIKFPECRGLGIIGTNMWSRETWDCDVCHGTGEITLLAGLPDPPQEATDET